MGGRMLIAEEAEADEDSEVQPDHLQLSGVFTACSRPLVVDAIQGPNCTMPSPPKKGVDPTIRPLSPSRLPLQKEAI